MCLNIDPDNIATEFEPVCDSDGKFNPKQCHGDICQCVNPETGDPIPNSVARSQNLRCEKGIFL